MAFALVVEDGTGLENSNSYSSVGEADDYHAANLYATEWTGPKKDVALAMATRIIDSNMVFRGQKLRETQALQWPRVGARNPDVGSSAVFAPLTARLSSQADFRSDEVPKILKDATAQLALELLRGDRTGDPETRGLKRLSLGQGAVSLEFDSAAESVPLTDEVRRMLTKLGETRYGGGRKKVVRVA
jgi:hypothetical protein